ncbi:hypothetical protein KR054_011730 [Drosophila jambulina]|nr:hypothetical protein KR054_011730 [Drosophila jambulina]
MIFLKLCWIFLAFSSLSFAWKATDKDHSLEDSYNELMSLSRTMAKQDNSQKQDNVASQEKPEVSKDNTEDEDLELQKAADVWYRNFMKNRTNRKRSDPSKEEDMYVSEKDLDHSETSDKPDYTEKALQARDNEIPDVDMKLKHLNKILREQENFETRNRGKVSTDLPKKDKVSDWDDDIYERTLHSLGNRLHQHYNLPVQKEYKSPKLSSYRTLGKDKLKLKQRRRSMDPLELVNLKTSMELMNDGYGSSTKELADISLESENVDSKYKTLNEGQIMDLPNSYDAEIPNYDPLNSLFQADRAMSSYLNKYKGQEGLNPFSIDDSSNMASSSIEIFGEPVAKIPELDYGLYTGIPGLKDATAEDGDLLTSIQGTYEYDTMLKTSNADEDYPITYGVTRNPERMAKLPASYPYAVAKLLADDLHYKNRQKRSAVGNKRPKRSLPENMDYNGFEEGLSTYNKMRAKYDNDSLAHVYDPVVKKRLKTIPKQMRTPYTRQTDNNQQQLMPEVNPQPAENFRASFNLSSFFNDIHGLQNTQKPQTVEQPVQQEVTQTPIEMTSSSLNSSGVRRFFARLFNKQTTMNPLCVPITSADNSTTASPDPSPSSTNMTMDNICDSPDSMKLNLSINAHVCGDPKTKHFYSNGSISLQPRYPKSIQDDDEGRFKRKQKEDVRKVINSGEKLNLQTEREQRLIKDCVKRPMKSIHRQQANVKHSTSSNVAHKKGRQVASEW